MSDSMKNEKKENKKTASSYSKGVRVIAIVGVILLCSLYLITLIAALTTSPTSAGLFKASLGASLFVPIMLWCYIRFAKFMGGKKDE